ncbi:hypothetical protein PUW25_26395 (plasmid) [Paenibacillus urinalis]|uniref:Uncharacterized protein n=1 Tax=Paenibacillus urinalis TaxID=521520 RepID=A0ABY7XH42_9BACL|nr:hypothetical protein [Paenibacillus urinalis]WDI05103.1 hypothetical protein PUW25_26395 [Paenibacillus urinalis]
MANARGSYFEDIDGQLWFVGNNSYSKGMFGWATGGSIAVPTLIPYKPRQVSAGPNHTLLIINDKLYGVGLNNNNANGIFLEQGQQQYSVITEIMEGVKYCAAGTDCSFAIKEDNSLWAMGFNGNGELGLNHTSSVPTWTKVIDGVHKVYAGPGFSWVIMLDGRVMASGSNLFNRIGDSAPNQFTEVFPELKERVKEISPGLNHSLFLTFENKLYGCGSGYGLAYGTSANSASLVYMKDNVKKAVGGYNNTIALDLDNKVHTTGNNTQGTLGIGNLTNSLVWNEMIMDEDGTPLPPAYDIDATSQNGAFLVITDSMDIYFTGRIAMNDIENKTGYPAMLQDESNTNFLKFKNEIKDLIYTIDQPFKIIGTCNLPNIRGLEAQESVSASTGIRYFLSTDKETWKRFDVESETWIDAPISETDVNDVAAKGMTSEELKALTAEQLAPFDGITFYVATVMWTTNEKISPSFRGVDAFVDMSVATPTVQSLSLEAELTNPTSPGYYVSRDDGTTWKEVTPDELTNLSDLPEGNELKIKTILENGLELYGLSYSWT